MLLKQLLQTIYIPLWDLIDVFHTATPLNREHATINSDLKWKSIWARKQICFNAFWITQKSWRSVNLSSAFYASYYCCSLNHFNRRWCWLEAPHVCDVNECDKGVEMMGSSYSLHFTRRLRCEYVSSNWVTKSNTRRRKKREEKKKKAKTSFSFILKT